MISKNKLEIMHLFRRDIFLRITIRGLMKKLQKKSYQRVYDAVIELEKQDVLRVERVGKSKQVSLDLSYEAISLLSFLDEQEALVKKIPNFRKVLGFNEFLDDILLVTGSYAKGAQTKKSDVDLVLITKDNALKKQKLLENLTSLMLPEIHPIIISQKDFVDMLMDKKPNFGKEIFKSRILFRNTSRYYELIKEAIEHGFKG